MLGCVAIGSSQHPIRQGGRDGGLHITVFVFVLVALLLVLLVVVVRALGLGFLQCVLAKVCLGEYMVELVTVERRLPALRCACVEEKWRWERPCS